MEKITSLQNPRIKAVRELQEKSRERRRQSLFVVEGLREITLALENGYRVDTLFFCDTMPSAVAFIARMERTYTTIPVSVDVFQKLAYREHSDGLLAVVHSRNLSCNELKLSGTPFVIVIETVEKPGNLGAILRTADAAKVDAVVVCDPLTDMYNPNIIRSSLGGVFTQQIAIAGATETKEWLRSENIITYASELHASQWYYETDFTQPCAIVMGTEADGLSDFWLAAADARIKIPMRGQIDSLNVSVATAVLTFEAMRQRQFM